MDGLFFWLPLVTDNAGVESRFGSRIICVSFWYSVLVSGVLADLVANNEELQKAAAEKKAIEKLAEFLLREEVPYKQLEGVLWGLTELCAKLEESRRQLLELKVRVINTRFSA